MRIQNLIKQIIPPVLINAVRKKSQSKIEYPTFEAAQFACQNVDYENRELTEVVVDKNLIYRKKLESDPVFDLPSLRILIALGAIQSGSNLNVLDFGGGGGYHYTIAKTALDPSKTINWCVVETSAMSHCAKRLADGSLSFFPDISSARDSFDEFDLVFTSSALQYCPNPLSFLRKLVDLDAPYLFITRTPFLESNKTIITTQVSTLQSNGPGPLPGKYKDRKITYPLTYVSRRIVEQIITEKYDIRFRIDESDGGFSFGNEKISTMGYLCVRRT
jgi:putative methyltransferase (TIGR04325 family)